MDNSPELLSVAFPADEHKRWPALRFAMSQLGRLPVCRFGIRMETLVLRFALLWLSFAIGLTALRFALESLGRSGRN
jgi:hypothetical protein